MKTDVRGKVHCKVDNGPRRSYFRFWYTYTPGTFVVEKYTSQETMARCVVVRRPLVGNAGALGHGLRYSSKKVHTTADKVYYKEVYYTPQ